MRRQDPMLQRKQFDSPCASHVVSSGLCVLGDCNVIDVCDFRVWDALWCTCLVFAASWRLCCSWYA